MEIGKVTMSLQTTNMGIIRNFGGYYYFYFSTVCPCGRGG